MTFRRSPVAPALALAAAIAAADVLEGGSILVGLLVVPPLLVAARSGPSATAVTLGACLTLAVAAGAWDEIFLTTDHLVPLVVVTVGGLLAVWIAAIRDRAERDRTYALFLAQASMVLEEAPDAKTLLRRLADLAVPRLSDWAAIHVVSTEGVLEDVIVAHADPERARFAEELRRRWPAELDPSQGPGRVMQTGEPELIENISDDMLARAARDREHLEALRSLGLRSAICVPLRSRGRTTATLFLGAAESRRRFRHIDLSRAMDLATIAAVALDNIRLLQETIEQERRTEEARAQLERAHERTKFLSQAGAMLESSLDIAATLAEVARMLVPRLADLCTVDVVGPGNSMRRLGAAAADPKLQETLSELVAKYPLDPESQHPIARVLRTGRVEVIADVGDEVLTPIALDERHLELMRRAVGRTALLLPLRAHGSTVGVLSLRWLERNRAIDPDDVGLLEELAARIALAAENARIYEERDAVARTLARSLLPAELPDIPGFDVGAHYLPATREPGVSGDFYDSFGLKNGRWIALVGDVCGKGVTAASLTALARHTLRTAALTAARPGRVLEVLNESMLSGAETGRFCTVAYAQLEPQPGGGGRVTVACGGHPAPIVLRRDGSIESVAAGGTIIGAFEGLSLDEAVVDLAVGDAFVLYTDGVTDVGTDLVGQQALEETLRRCVGMTATEIAKCVTARAVELQQGEARDDIAVLALRALDG